MLLANAKNRPWSKVKVKVKVAKPQLDGFHNKNVFSQLF